MKDENCDLKPSKALKEKKFEVVDGVTIKYHANGKRSGRKEKSSAISRKGIGNGTVPMERSNVRAILKRGSRSANG